MSRPVLFVYQWPILLALLIAGLLPIYGPLMPSIEGYLLPVVAPIKLLYATPEGDGITVFQYEYTKLRQCEFLGISAYDKAGNPLPIRAADGENAGTFPVGKNISQRWKVGVGSLDGVSIYFIHRCSPLWLTETKVR